MVELRSNNNDLKRNSRSLEAIQNAFIDLVQFIHRVQCHQKLSSLKMADYYYFLNDNEAKYFYVYFLLEKKVNFRIHNGNFTY